jgi:hypothetical protein
VSTIVVSNVITQYHEPASVRHEFFEHDLPGQEDDDSPLDRDMAIGVVATMWNACQKEKREFRLKTVQFSNVEYECNVRRLKNGKMGVVMDRVPSQPFESFRIPNIFLYL